MQMFVVKFKNTYDEFGTKVMNEKLVFPDHLP